MDSSMIIGVMIALCTFMLTAVLFSGALKALIRFAVGAIVGGICIYVINMLFPMLNIGVNAVTATAVGLLGLPGIGLLIFAAIVL